MAKEELVGGLKTAIARGESLQKAMMSFYNAGYSKEEIEEAVHYLQAPQLFGQPITQPQPAQQPTQPIQQPVQSSETSQSQFFSFQTPISLLPATQPQQQPLKMVQKVSEYGTKPKSTGKIITIIFVFLLIVLLGILVAVILFREELASFFNKLL